MKSPNPDTASQKGYNIAAMGGKNTPQRRSWQNPTTEGNQREIFGQGRPMAKDSSGNGANWWLGTKSDPPISGTAVESRLFFEGTVSATDMSRATDAREASRIGIFGTSNSYGGSYGRVTNEALGRDLNPLGRGDGEGYFGGSMNLYDIAPRLPFSEAQRGTGNSANNSAGAPVDWGGLPLNITPSYPPYVDVACTYDWCRQMKAQYYACGLNRPYSENEQHIIRCGPCGGWGCSATDHCNDPVGCAYKHCRWKAVTGGCPGYECLPYYWGSYCWPQRCIRCDRYRSCPWSPAGIFAGVASTNALNPKASSGCCGSAAVLTLGYRSLVAKLSRAASVPGWVPTQDRNKCAAAVIQARAKLRQLVDKPFGPDNWRLPCWMYEAIRDCVTTGSGCNVNYKYCIGGTWGPGDIFTLPRGDDPGCEKACYARQANGTVRRDCAGTTGMDRMSVTDVAADQTTYICCSNPCTSGGHASTVAEMMDTVAHECLHACRIGGPHDGYLMGDPTDAEIDSQSDSYIRDVLATWISEHQ